MSNPIAYKIGQYHFATPEHNVTRTFRIGRKQKTFRLVLSSAYNAGGLIGPEINGIAILIDGKSPHVIADKIHCGRHDLQKTVFQFLQACPYGDFVETVNGCGRNRYKLNPYVDSTWQKIPSRKSARKAEQKRKRRETYIPSRPYVKPEKTPAQAFIESRALDWREYGKQRQRGAANALSYVKFKRDAKTLAKTLGDEYGYDFGSGIIPRDCWQTSTLEYKGFLIVANQIGDDSGYDPGDCFGTFHYPWDHERPREGHAGIIAARNCSKHDLDRSGDYCAVYTSNHCTFQERLNWKRKAGFSKHDAWNLALSEYRQELESFRDIMNESTYGYTITVCEYDSESEQWEAIADGDSVWGFEGSYDWFECLHDSGAIENAKAQVDELRKARAVTLRAERNANRAAKIEAARAWEASRPDMYLSMGA